MIRILSELPPADPGCSPHPVRRYPPAWGGTSEAAEPWIQRSVKLPRRVSSEKQDRRPPQDRSGPRDDRRLRTRAMTVRVLGNKARRSRRSSLRLPKPSSLDRFAGMALLL